MEASSLVFFAQVVDAGSFSAAARALGLDRSNVSRRIRDLEQQLACQLLRRSTRSMELTEAGAFFYERCCVVRAETAYAHASLLDLSGAVRGALTVSCPPVLGRDVLAPLLVSFCERHPHVDLQVILRNHVEDLIPAKIDVCITIAHGPAPGTVARVLAAVDWVICASPAYLAGQPLPQQAADLARVAWIDQSEREWLDLVGPLGSTRVKTRTRLACVDLPLVRGALIQGMGVGVLPDYIAAAALREGSLVRLLPDHVVQGTPGNTLYALTPATQYVPTKVKALMELITAAFEPGGGMAPPVLSEPVSRVRTPALARRRSRSART